LGTKLEENPLPMGHQYAANPWVNPWYPPPLPAVGGITLIPAFKGCSRNYPQGGWAAATFLSGGWRGLGVAVLGLQGSEKMQPSQG